MLAAELHYRGISVRFDNVRPKNSVVELLPFVGGATGTALYPYVYVLKHVYQNLVSDSPDAYHVALILHEQTHIARIKEQGVLKFYVRYVLSKRFRFEEEIAATAPQLAFIKSLGLDFDLERKARSLSSWLYMRPATYDQALQRLVNMWSKQTTNNK